VAALEARLAALVEGAEARSAAFCRDAAPEALEARERRVREREAVLRQELSAAWERREAARAGGRARLAALRALRAELEQQEAANAGARALRITTPRPYLPLLASGLFFLASHRAVLSPSSPAAARPPHRPNKRNPQPTTHNRARTQAWRASWRRRRRPAPRAPASGRGWMRRCASPPTRRRGWTQRRASSGAARRRRAPPPRAPPRS